MDNNSGVSSVVGVVLLLLLVVIAASVIGLTLSTATQNAVESTPNVQFIPSANPQMLYHGGGDVLYKARLKFYVNGNDITSNVMINSLTTWTEWRTGEAIELPAGYNVTNLTIIAIDTLGRDQLLYKGSGVIPPTIPPTVPTIKPTTDPSPTTTTTPTPTPEPTPNPYYTVGSDHADGFSTVGELVESLNNWSNALYGADVALTYGGNQIGFFGEVPIGREPIRITEGMGTVSLITYGGTGTLTEVPFTRAPGYEGELLVISSDAELATAGAMLKLDGMGHGAAPLLVITSGGSLRVQDYITLINNTNPTGNGGAIYSEGDLFVSTNLIVYNNSALNGGGVYNAGTSFLITACDIYNNVASENGGGIYNAGSNTVTINNPNAKVHDNSATDGGGVYNIGTLQGGFPITGNTASGNGGGIYNMGSVTFSSGDQSVLDNSATYGGGVYNDGAIDTAGPISGNTASVSGGGVYNAGTGTYRFSWTSTITSNQAQDGGGIYNAGFIPFFGGTISDNTVTIDGGGIYNTGDITFNNWLPISNNEAIRNGGGLYNAGSYTMTSGSFTGNIAGNIGDKVYATDGSTNSISPGILILTKHGNYYYADN